MAVTEKNLNAMGQLCGEIGMPEEVTGEVLCLLESVETLPRLPKLLQENAWKEGYQELLAILGEDPRGYRMLCYMLLRAGEARAEFEKRGLPETVYVDTMACFSRFVKEHYVSYGRYGFDRGFWTVRQISCKLLRIGQLEYELTHLDGASAISLHIPTDVRLVPALLRESYQQARTLLEAAFPEYRDAPVFCCSWLLSPTLKMLLPPGSNILRFQRSFTVTPMESSRGYLQWVYKNPNLPLEALPEDTSLQRNLKAYLLSGGTFADGKGMLIREPFREDL